ncbi:MAG: VTT domain-containing protein [Desulfosporosinus sp.]|nr:VTT domain-containing protein [Desulfosporosinus sp.]
MKKKCFSSFTLLVSLTFVILLYPKLQHPAALQNLVTEWGSISLFVDLFIITLLMLFPVVPFVLIAGVNTILYGWVGGILLSLAGSLLGASLGFWLARTLGQTWVQPKVAKLGKWGALLRGNSFTVVFLSRLIPILPSAAVNYASGLSQMTFLSFLLATLLGKTPMIIWESWVGHDLWKISHHPGRLLLALASGALLFGSVGLYWYLSNKFPKEPLS